MDEPKRDAMWALESGMLTQLARALASCTDKDGEIVTMGPGDDYHHTSSRYDCLKK